jgi:hypothetical protein
VDARSHGLVRRYSTHRVDCGGNCFGISFTEITV